MERQVVGREEDLEFIAEVSRPFLEQYDAAADLPVPAIYQQLDRMFPKSRFIMIRRNPEAWADSILKRYAIKKKSFVSPFACAFYWQYLEDRPTCTSEMTKISLVEIYQRHMEAVDTYFAGRACYGTFDLSSPTLATSLATFLGLPDKMSFPHSNTASETRTIPLLKRVVANVSIPLRRTFRRYYS